MEEYINDSWRSFEHKFGVEMISFIKAKLSEISSETHPKAPLYNIIIIVDTVFRQKRNFKHEKQLCQQYRHIAT